MLLLARQLGSILHNNEGIATVVVDGIQCVKNARLRAEAKCIFRAENTCFLLFF